MTAMAEKTPTDAIRDAHRRALDMRTAIQQRSQELKDEQDRQRAREDNQNASPNT